MALLIAVIGAVWLALLTLALIGLNTRIAVLRKAMSERGGAIPSWPVPSNTQPVPPDAVILVVSEYCSGCSQAIEALGALAPSLRGEFDNLLVLTPNPADERVHSPLQAIADPELYRRLYPGTTPSLIVTDDQGRPVLARPISDNSTISMAISDSRMELSAIRSLQDKKGLDT